MTMKPLRIRTWDLVSPLVRTFDMMSAAVAEHGMRVAYIALRLCEEMEFPAAERREVGLAGALHDVGAFSLDERLDILAFEDTCPMRHAAAGALLLRGFPPFGRIASLVLYHHLPWGNGNGAAHAGMPVPRGSHVLHLADRTAVRFSGDRPALGQVAGIRDALAKGEGELFVPEFVDALRRLAAKDFVWLDLMTPAALENALREELGGQWDEIDPDGLVEFSRLICRLIDFRSEFTATHSSGVAAAAEMLAGIVGFSRQERRMFEVAGYLHDLGKLAVPSEVLEKPGKLSQEEWSVMRTHVYYTYQVLSPIEALDMIASWSGLHQERLDGSGYPFHFSAESVPLGARVMAVADVFTGLAEDRPYRKGMDRDAAIRTLRGMAGRGELDGKLVELLVADYDGIDAARSAAQERAVREYEAFRAALDEWQEGGGKDRDRIQYP